MIISNLGMVNSDEVGVHTATVSWEDNDFPTQELIFEIAGTGRAFLRGAEGPSADAFLAACFPLAAVHGEARLRIEGRPCPMLVEGLYTAHAWWATWGGMPRSAPSIESLSRKSRKMPAAPRQGVAFLSGGVDGLHMLMRNHRLYDPDDAAYVREVLFIHGFDIGKRARDPENARYQMMLRRLEPIVADRGLRLVTCRTNLRHLPSKRDFWENRHSGAGLAAVGHAAVFGPALLFVGASWPTEHQVPWGSHPAIDGLFSSQRITVIHDGSRFSRLQKVIDLASWPIALAALRVCPANAGSRPNCGECEKCLRTRLELLAAGIAETEAFGPSITPKDIADTDVLGTVGDRVIFYEDLLEPLRARGHHELCRALERKMQLTDESRGQRKLVTRADNL